MKSSVIVSGARTPIGSFLGSLSSLKACELASFAIKAAIEKARIDNNDVQEVIMGQVLQGGVGQAPARQASLGAGLSVHTPCVTVNKVCGSGLKAVMMAADEIALSRYNTIVAGGMESMSNAPYLLPEARAGLRMGDHKTVDLMINDGLQDPYSKAHMGSFGDACAEHYKFSRSEQDAFAIESYQRAQQAQSKGYFSHEIVAIPITRKEKIIVAHDEEPARFNQEKLTTLKPAFLSTGSVTAANASKINDGAAALVIMEEQEAVKRKLAPCARIIAYTTYAAEPAWFTTAPIMAIKSLLKDASLKVSDIDLFEINEAFSVVAMAAIKELGLNHAAVNVFGGAVSLGHPIGCSGARILLTLTNALAIYKKRLGCAAICLGGGEAVAMLIERVE